MIFHFKEEVMSDYFGKKCGYFCGSWDYRDIDAVTSQSELEEIVPDLSFCTHPRNTETTEGNCRVGNCPMNYINDDFIPKLSYKPKEEENLNIQEGSE
jgi:hypothetical protein